MEKDRKIKLLSLVALIVAVLGLTVAFAALSQTLTINGTASVNAAEWDVHFENLSEPVIKGSASVITVPSISEDKISINNMGIGLSKPKDEITYTVDVVNKGSIAAEISSIETTTLTPEQAKILSFNVTYNDGRSVSEKDVLKAGGKDTVTINVKFKDDIEASDLPKEAIEVSLTLKINYVQSDGTSDIPNTTTPSDSKTYNVGDEIALGDEHFYVISDNGDTVTALAKYNLNAGKNKNPNGIENIQNESAKGIQFVNGRPSNETIIGGIDFTNPSTSGGDVYYYPAYWGLNWELLSKYGTSYPAYVFDSNSKLYDSLIKYENYLNNTLGKTSVNARLITYDEVSNLGCSSQSYSCSNAPSWVYSVSYWTGSAKDHNTVYMVNPEPGNEFSAAHYSVDIYGIRPVITISKTEI